MKTEFEELQEVCMSVIKYLRQHNPHTAVIVTSESIRVEETKMFVPLNENNDQHIASRCLVEP